MRPVLVLFSYWCKNVYSMDCSKCSLFFALTIHAHRATNIGALLKLMNITIANANTHLNHFYRWQSLYFSVPYRTSKHIHTDTHTKLTHTPDNSLLSLFWRWQRQSIYSCIFNNRAAIQLNRVPVNSVLMVWSEASNFDKDTIKFTLELVEFTRMIPCQKLFEVNCAFCIYCMSVWAKNAPYSDNVRLVADTNWLCSILALGKNHFTFSWRFRRH